VREHIRLMNRIIRTIWLRIYIL